MWNPRGLDNCDENDKDENGRCQIMGNEINDDGIPNFSDIIKTCKMYFPICYNYQNRHLGDGCVKEDGSAPSELTHASKNGWCATELNSDKSPKKYAYCGESRKEIALNKASREMAENEMRRSRDNTGI